MTGFGSPDRDPGVNQQKTQNYDPLLLRDSQPAS